MFAANLVLGRTSSKLWLLHPNRHHADLHEKKGSMLGTKGSLTSFISFSFLSPRASLARV